MNADAVDKIKKLLRTAKDRAGTPEGDAATYIANKLMDKHGIHVNSDDHKVIIENDGAHWRAQVLTATAKSQGCRVYRYKEGRQLAVVGDQADVSRSIDMFMLLVPKIVLACHGMWREYAERELRNLDDRKASFWAQALGRLRRQPGSRDALSMFDFAEAGLIVDDNGNLASAVDFDANAVPTASTVSDKIVTATRAWWRAFMNEAADQIIDRFVPPAKVERTMSYDPWPLEYLEMQRAVDRNKPPSVVQRERAALSADVKALADVLGDADLAQRVLNAARWQARQTVRMVQPTETRAGRMLLAASSFLPPPPPPPPPPKVNRFTYLDFE